MEKEEDIGNGEGKYFIVVYGPPASGKSSLARQIYSEFQKEECRNEEKKKNAVLISADCFEEFLREHSLKELEEIAKDGVKLQQLNEYRLKRAQFIQQNWKNSRLFIKEHLHDWISQYQLVILEDDMLLRSQRKHCRHIIQRKSILYLEVCIDASIQECLDNLKKREQLESSEHILTQSSCRQAVDKFQQDQNPYLIKKKPFQKLNWQQIKKLSKKVTIQHPQLHMKAEVSSEQAAKDQTQVKIRRFISEIMSNKELQNCYFPNQSTKTISSLLASLKKRYSAKNKTFQGFLQFLKNETEPSP